MARWTCYCWGGAVGELIVEWVARVGYQGNLHPWNARGGEYEYQNRRGRFEDDRHFVRYIVLHQVFFGGMHAQLGHAGHGWYGRVGGDVSGLALVDDRDTHFSRDTDYLNSYRLGWYVRPQLTVGKGMGRGVAVEAFYELTLQLDFAETGTIIRTPDGVRAPEERPNYRMTVHRLGVRFIWALYADR